MIINNELSGDMTGRFFKKKKIKKGIKRTGRFALKASKNKYIRAAALTAVGVPAPVAMGVAQASTQVGGDMVGKKFKMPKKLKKVAAVARVSVMPLSVSVSAAKNIQKQGLKQGLKTTAKSQIKDIKTIGKVAVAASKNKYVRAGAVTAVTAAAAYAGFKASDTGMLKSVVSTVKSAAAPEKTPVQYGTEYQQSTRPVADYNSPMMNMNVRSSAPAPRQVVVDNVADMVQRANDEPQTIPAEVERFNPDTGTIEIIQTGGKSKMILLAGGAALAAFLFMRKA